MSKKPRRIWEAACGPIPPGFVVHHIEPVVEPTHCLKRNCDNLVWEQDHDDRWFRCGLGVFPMTIGVKGYKRAAAIPGVHEGFGVVPADEAKAVAGCNVRHQRK